MADAAHDSALSAENHTKSLHEKLQGEQFDITKRTVERDLLALSEMFPLVSDERDKPYGWSWSKDAPVFNLPGLSHNEALTLAMVEQHLNSLLPSSTLSQLQPYFKAARQHLSNIPQNERARYWLNKVRTVPPSQPLMPPGVKPAVQYTVYEALLADKQLEINTSSAARTRRLNTVFIRSLPCSAAPSPTCIAG